MERKRLWECREKQKNYREREKTTQTGLLGFQEENEYEMNYQWMGRENAHEGEGVEHMMGRDWVLD